MGTRYDNLEISSRENRGMQQSYLSLLRKREGDKYRLKEYQNAEGIGIDYELVDWSRLFGRREPDSYFDMVNSNGFARVNVWGRTWEDKSVGMLVKTELYTRGVSGEEKGNGRIGILQLKNILQYMANKSGVPVTWLIDANMISKKYFEGQYDCEKIDGDRVLEVTSSWIEGDSNRRKMLEDRMESATEDARKYPHYLMKFEPESDNVSLGEATRTGLDFIVDKLLMYNY